jgi:peptidoglycan/xylan/chitin deacetylase (PgdA/CDA1 family)
MACLTHDVDFVGIRDHVLDHTMWGFLYRCLVTSTLNACKGKMTWSNCLQNWKAALSLPLVHLGICDDFWLEFDRYMDREKGLGSTFFFIPFKNTAGKLGFSAAPGNRAAKYDVAQLQEHIRHLRKNGCEIGVHGINAWQYSQDACMELSTIREITGESEIGIRIHWLYWDGNSRNVLAEAGLSYDSTFGYNDAIGFRAGTVQAFCHLGTNNLVELPLNIQDTAMFYPDRMNLSEPEALRACKGLISWTIQFGGALTLNWHTRSLSPERLWGDFYARLLEEIQKHRVWFGTAGDIVRWFRKRRALRFDSVRVGEDFIVVSLGSDLSPSGPSLCLRIYNPRRSSATSTSSRWAVPRYVEVPWNGEEELQIPRGTGAVNQS